MFSENLFPYYLEESNLFHIFAPSKKCLTFALAKQKRNVAQLVAHYVRDVGVGRSNRLFPTERLNSYRIKSFLLPS